MKFPVYIAVLFAFAAVSCSTARSFTMEDDIYYVPGKKALIVKEVEDITGHDISTTNHTDASKNGQQVINTRTGKTENVNINTMTTQAEEMLANNETINETIYENTGFWIGGYKGNESDLQEIQQIINMYPDGFAYFNGNGYEIAQNLSFDPDWNVYTDNGRYWWFPSSSNINLYTTLLFGTYPKYIWTVVWDNPRFDSWAFDNSFNSRWSFNFGLGSPGWNFGFGWNSGWYNPWYGGWYDPWYRPYYGYYPGWGYPHWHNSHWNHPHWNHRPPHWNGGSGNRPRPITGLRPNNGGGVAGSVRPNRPSTGNVSRPGISRPNTSGMVRPGTTTRPGNSVSRPGSSVSRPNSAVSRPGSAVSRPNNNQSYTRPGSTTRPPTVTRPGTTTRPSSVSRPSNSPTQQYTRPTSRPNSTGNVKSYTRPQSSYRPTYNNNSSSRSNSSYSRPTTTQRSSSSGSSYSPTRSNNGGNRSGSTVHRPTRR